VTALRVLTRAFVFVVLLLGAVRAAPAPAPAAPAGRPNIVFILADDLGYGDVGAYGQTKIRTPRLDRMAREGTRFTQFYAGSPVCAPSRSVLMTGQHTGHTYIRGNKEHPGGQEPLPDEVMTVADLLKQAGYATGMFGKWGLGGVDTEGTPSRHGFDEFFGYYDQRRAHFYYPEYLHRNAEKVALPNRVREEPRSPGAGPAVVRGRYSHDAIAEEALAFLDRHQRERFFLYLPFTIPHAELQAPDDAYAQYLENGRSIFPETPFPEDHYGAQAMPHATYAAMVSRMDRDVGRILDKLRELGLDRNTIVFFTSDNGPSVEGGSDPEFFDSSGPLRGVKRDVYEGGIRVPMIAWGPGRIPAGRTSDQVWALWDVLPTLAGLAGANPPAGIDGISMVPSLTGRGRQRQHDSLYWEFYERGSRQAVRMGRWKGVRQPMLTGKFEVYDLQTDPGEKHDVAAGHPGVAARLARLLDEGHAPSALWRAPAEGPTR
jgi:arylsulfatase A-like enzyme